MVQDKHRDDTRFIWNKICLNMILIEIDETSTYLQIMKDVFKYSFLSYSEMWVKIIWMGAHVDNPIHIQVEIVKLRYL